MIAIASKESNPYFTSKRQGIFLYVVHDLLCDGDLVQGTRYY